MGITWTKDDYGYDGFGRWDGTGYVYRIDAGPDGYWAWRVGENAVCSLCQVPFRTATGAKTACNDDLWEIAFDVNKVVLT